MNPDAPDTIHWFGDPLTSLPRYPTEIPEQHRYTSPPVDPTWINHDPPPDDEPRRYADPRGPMPPRLDTRP